MNLLDHILGKSLLCMIDDEIDTAEVVYSFKDIIHVNSVRGDTDGVGFIDITRLVVRQFAALDVVGVIGQVNLYAMVDASLQLRALLLSENLKQGRYVRLAGATLR